MEPSDSPTIEREYRSIAQGDGQIAVCLHLPAAPRAVDVPAAVLFLHSLGGCKLGPGNVFPLLADHLARNGFLCIRFDYLGNGESSGSASEDLGPKAGDAERVVQVLHSEHRFEDLYIVTISYSASLTFFLGRIRHLVKGIAFLSPVFPHVTGEKRRTPHFMATVLEYASKLLLWRTYARLLKGDIDLGAVVDVLRRKMPWRLSPRRSPGPRGAARFCGPCRCPAVILVGDKDPHCQRAMGVTTAIIEKDSLLWQVRVLKGMNHNIVSSASKVQVTGEVVGLFNSLRSLHMPPTLLNEGTNPSQGLGH